MKITIKSSTCEMAFEMNEHKDGVGLLTYQSSVKSLLEFTTHAVDQFERVVRVDKERVKMMEDEI